MAEVVLFHHALGRTAGVVAFAGDLQDAGHTVHTPDLYGGRTFDTIAEGVAYAEQIGFANLIEHGVEVADGLPDVLVYGGFSLGVLPAQRLAQTRRGARGALLFDACVPPTEFSDGWPDGVDVQIHGMASDPFFAGEGDIDAAREVVGQAQRTTRAELFVYAGGAHLFADRFLPSYDADASTQLMSRVLDFLAQLDAESTGGPPLM